MGELNMRTGVLESNKACILIRQGLYERAIAHLNDALRAVSDLEQIQQSHHQEPYPIVTHDQDNHSHPIHHYPHNVYDEGMNTFSQPFYINDPLIDDSCDATKATIFFNLGIAHSRCREQDENKSDAEVIINLQKSLQIQLQPNNNINLNTNANADANVNTNNFINNNNGTCSASTSPSPSLPAPSLFPSSSSSSSSSQTTAKGPPIHVILHNIGHSHFKIGRYNYALASYEQALDILTTNHIELHRLDISSTLNCIAMAKFYSCQGNMDEILIIFERALALRIDRPNAEYNRETATIIQNAGRVRIVRGEFETALTIFTEALKQRTSALGPNHIDVAASLISMAQSEEYLGHFPEAIALHKRFLEVTILNKGEESQDVVKALLRIGQTCQKSHDREQALEFFSRALTLAQIAFGPGHATVANTYNKIGNVLFELSKDALALEAYQSGLDLERVIYPYIHEQIAVTLLNIAQIYQRQGKFDQALELYMETLEIRRQLNDKKSIAHIFSNLGTIYETVGELDHSERVFKEAIAIRRELRQTFMLASSLNALGVVQYKRGAYNLAFYSFMEAIEVRKSLQEISTRDIINLYFNAATVCKHMGESRKALELYKETIRLEELNSNGPDGANVVNIDNSNRTVAHLHFEIGQIYRNEDNFDEALSYFRQSSQMCLANPTIIDRRFTHKVLRALGDMHLLMGNTEHAMESYSAAATVDDTADLVLGSSVTDFSVLLYIRLRETNPPAAAAA